MYPKNIFFTFESVTEGHPDKLCGQVSGHKLILGRLNTHLKR